MCICNGTCDIFVFITVTDTQTQSQKHMTTMIRPLDILHNNDKFIVCTCTDTDGYRLLRDWITSYCYWLH